jgi:hypothetical protein
LTTFFKQYPDQAERIKLALINLLKADNDVFMDPKRTQNGLSEGDSEHYAEAIDVISSLNDERVIPALMGAISTGAMATRGILKFGEKALSSVMSQLTSPLPEVRSSAITTAVAILKTKKDAASHAQIINMIRLALNDPEHLVRGSALSAIEGVNDRQQFVPALREMAEHDPARVPGESDYPLRVEAQRLLEKIGNR